MTDIQSVYLDLVNLAAKVRELADCDAKKAEDEVAVYLRRSVDYKSGTPTLDKIKKLNKVHGDIMLVVSELMEIERGR